MCHLSPLGLLQAALATMGTDMTGRSTTGKAPHCCLTLHHHRSEMITYVRVDASYTKLHLHQHCEEESLSAIQHSFNCCYRPLPTKGCQNVDLSATSLVLVVLVQAVCQLLTLLQSTINHTKTVCISKLST